MDNQIGVRKYRFRMLDLLVAIACCAVLCALLVWAINSAKISSQKMQSRNNLKQFALAVHNYHDIHRSLPLGAESADPAKANHGWFYRISPLLESSSWYQSVLGNIVWDSPFNAFRFKQRYSWNSRPSVKELTTDEGFVLLHYMPNPNAIHAKETVRFKEFSGNEANVWLFGEIAGNYVPFGYPFSWRPLSVPLNSGPNSYGGWRDGANFAYVDGSVRFLTNDTDRSLITKMADAFPPPKPELTAIPNRTFTMTQNSIGKAFEQYGTTSRPEHSKRIEGTTVYFGLDDRVEAVEMFIPSDTSDGLLFNFEQAAELPEFPVLLLRLRTFDDQMAGQVSTMLPKVQSLLFSNYDLTESGEKSLQELKNLRDFSAVMDAETANRLRAKLPNCNVTNRNY